MALPYLVLIMRSVDFLASTKKDQIQIRSLASKGLENPGFIYKPCGKPAKNPLSSKGKIGFVAFVPISFIIDKKRFSYRIFLNL